MLFSSFVFIGIFLPITLLLFWLTPSDRGKRIVLLVTSLFYYSFWFPVYIFLLAGLVGIAWLCALMAQKRPSALPVVIAAVSLLGVLVYFKYAGFLAQVAADLGLATGLRDSLPHVALPLGISFIVFQALAYVVDVHRREFEAEPRFSVVLLFKAFFPQLIAGPICRAHELIPQLRGSFSFDANRFINGLAIFCVGLFLKSVFADGLAPQVDELFAQTSSRTQGEAWAAMVGFGFQIYADFWGYSTMAVGLAKMFGITIPVNFNLPYIAGSIRDFWRRWHITLSQWLRDYLYKPLGGSHHGLPRTMIALSLTMLLGGLWHGANYTFIIWGAIHASLLVSEHLLRPWSARVGQLVPAPVMYAGGWLYSMFAVFVAWVFFRASSTEQALTIVRELWTGIPRWDGPVVVMIFSLAAALLALQFPLEKFLDRMRKDAFEPAAAVVLSFVLVVAAVVLSAPVAVPFIYFQF